MSDTNGTTTIAPREEEPSQGGAAEPALSPAEEPSLTARVVKGAAWVLAGKIVSRGLQLVKLVVLARLLSPEDFGLFGIVLLAIAALDVLTQTGFNTALIQRKGNVEAYLDTAWTVQLIRGLVLAAVLFAVAPVVGWFFEEPPAVLLLRVMCVSVALGGFVNIGIIYFRKELQFHRQVAYSVLSTAAGFVVGIVLAFRLRNVWALVWAQVAVSVSRCALSYAMHPYRPRPRWNANQALELFGFGKWLLGNSALMFVATKADKLVVGKLLGAASLGLLTMAERISCFAGAEVSSLANSLMMPAYARVQDDRARLTRGFLSVFESVLCLVGPVAVGLVIMAPALVRAVLGSDWAPVILPLQIMAAGTLLSSIAGLSAPVFLGTGHPHFQFWKSLVRATVTLAAVYPLTRLWGVPGTALAVFVGRVALLPFFHLALRITGVPWTRLMVHAVPGIALCVAAAGAGLGKLVPTEGLWPTLWTQFAAGGLCVASTVLAMAMRGTGPYALLTRSLRAARGAHS